MNLSLTPQQLIASVAQFLHRFHVIIFTLVVVGALSVATFMLSTVTTKQDQAMPAPEQTTFDKSTMDKVRSLRKSSESSQTLTLPSGRTDPFSG